MTLYNHGQPSRGDAVWVEGRKPQPNGYISRIDYEEHEVVVVYHDNGGVEYFPIERLLGCREGNKWMLYADKHEPEREEEQRLDVMILFDETPVNDIPRLIFLSLHFNYTDSRYKAGCIKRRNALAKLIGLSTGVDWDEVERNRRIHSVGASISARIRRKL